MRSVLTAIALLCASMNVQADGDMRPPGFGSVAEVSVESADRFRIDGRAMTLPKLRKWLVTLDEQLPVGHLHLKMGGPPASAEQVEQLKTLATEIGAQFVADPGALDVAPAQAPAE